jgi:uncharacterized protein (DUF1015 family)
VVSRREAAALAEGNPLSFLHVVRSDIDLPMDVDAHDPRVYDRARTNLARLVAEGALRCDAEPALFLYRQVREGRSQVGVVGCVHVDDYERDVIKKHEKTFRDKEDDRTRHVLTLDAHAEPVFLMYRGQRELDGLVDGDTARAPLEDFTTADGVRHTVWRAADQAAYVRAFGAVPCAYVADGHHRSASAWRAARERRAADPRHRGDEEYEWFLAALFPAGQLRILAYNRLVRDLGGQSPATLLDRLGRVGRLQPTEDPLPPTPGTFCFYVAARWYRLILDPGSMDRSDPVASLDVALLQERVLGPVLGIGDPRADPRLDFVGGIQSTVELERRVDSGEMALAVSLHPTSIDQLIAVADAGKTMPPKSTWFEPKLLSGLFVHPLTREAR